MRRNNPICANTPQQRRGANAPLLRRWATALALVFAAMSPAPLLADATPQYLPGNAPVAGMVRVPETAALTQGPTDAKLTIPHILSQRDADRYRRIMELQERGDWRRADKEIARLKDRILLGHVYAQRYLHPTKYRSRYRELRDWLASYADHPSAPRIYRLALRRKPADWRAPPRPTYLVRAGEIEKSVKRHRLSRTAKRESQRVRQAAKQFYRGNYKTAYQDANRAAGRAGAELPDAHWIAGLASYRLGNQSIAAAHFAAMAESSNVTAWTRAAAAFWAARAYMVAGAPGEVNHWLAVAAAERHTFYGLLARRVLGQRQATDFALPQLDADGLAAIAALEPARRAFALLQIGQEVRAERELKGLARRNDAALVGALTALAIGARLPSLSLVASSRLADFSLTPPDAGLFPLPSWQPENGFAIDRALIFAFMRQESAFNPRAKSRAGARGLMQLMPGTAGFMAGQRYRGRQRDKLYDPAHNMALGQKYLEYLLGHELVEGDLLLTAIAYNGGPGNLAKWRRRARIADDPLLFIESIPARETRLFVERVLANLWMYRMRLGQPTPSLDSLAAGERPVYVAVDDGSWRLARDGRN